jgi:hypothetical protein|tara:strand:- start:735 stop:902 length:168 start_codon:yes stop_codon:yes gene_type:complete
MGQATKQDSDSSQDLRDPNHIRYRLNMDWMDSKNEACDKGCRQGHERPEQHENQH